MDTKIILNSIILLLFKEGNNVRVKSYKEDISLVNQDIKQVSEIIHYNFDILYKHYKKIIRDNENCSIEDIDITYISINILMFYLYVYNLWKNSYTKQQNRDLKFNIKDFENPSTHDIIFDYFKAKYVNDWRLKSAILLGKKLDELNIYYNEREMFYKK